MLALVLGLLDRRPAPVPTWGPTWGPTWARTDDARARARTRGAVNGGALALSLSLSLRRALFALCTVAACVLSVRQAHADEAVGDGRPSVASFVGAQTSGLPGIGRVGVAADAPRRVVGSVEAGYGFTDSIAGTPAGAHHRLGGTAAVALQPLPVLSAALMVRGRWEKHPDDVLGSSTSTVGEPLLVVRGARGVARSFALGGELGLRIPGGEVPSIRPGASALDARALVTLAPPGSGFALALNAGYRLDRSGDLVESADRPRLRSGDRLTLGLSDSDAVLLGVGASRRAGALELLVEGTWDILVGSRAPGAFKSPLRIGTGARYHLPSLAALGNLQLELRGEVVASGRPPAGPADAFAPIDPTFSILAGLRWVLPFSGAAPQKPVSRPPRESGSGPGRGADAGANAVAKTGAVHGRTTSEAGEPVSGASVTVIAEDGEERRADSAADGSFKIEGVHPGRARASASAAGFEEAAIDIDVDPRAPAAADLVLKRAVKKGQLRGLVRSFNGKPLAATVRVEPAGLEAKTDADGTFQIDLPPGAYEVIIASPRHTGQRRPVQVEENGVTILNADLRPGPP